MVQSSGVTSGVGVASDSCIARSESLIACSYDAIASLSVGSTTDRFCGSPQPVAKKIAINSIGVVIDFIGKFFVGRKVC